MSADEPLENGKAFKIMTGAPIPDNANAVVMVENTESRDEAVVINKLPSAKENIRKKANDIACGDTLISKGTRLHAEHLMLLSSQGNSTVAVYRKLRVGVVATGSELAAPGDALKPTQIFESNRVGVSSILRNENVELVDFGIVKDDETSLRKLLLKPASVLT